MKRKFVIFLFLVSLSLVSCEKYVETDLPKDQLVSELVFVDDKTATASVVGVYSRMNGLNYQFANVLTTFLGAMSADEFRYAFAFANYDEFYNNKPSTTNQYIGNFWNQPYNYIYHANACLEGLAASTSLSEEVSRQLRGEALFVRAFCHFYLVNFFGDVPLVQSTDYAVNTSLPRTPTSEVMQAIISDLVEAKSLMIDGYPQAENVLTGDGERTRPNKVAATALLARVYLYNEQWADAEREAGEVIANGNYALLQGDDMNGAFMANSREAIWQLQAVNTLSGRNTWEGTLLLPSSATTAPQFRLLPGGLRDAFEEGDHRRANWVGSYTDAAGTNTYLYPYKYKVRLNVSPAIEYAMVLRLAEQFLIRAEACIRQSRWQDARNDLNIIRQRAGLADLPSFMEGDNLWLALEKERQVELFAEWGHRWFDLKRWPSLQTSGKTRADDVLSVLKPTTWQSTGVLFPLPLRAIQTNPNLVQNEGYN